MTEKLTNHSPEMAEFKQPPVTSGMQILWYRNGVVRRQDAMVGYMIHAGTRTSQVFLANGRRVDAVRHVDDPKLLLNADQRENGAWDYTEDRKEYVAYKKTMERRFRQLERDVNAIIVGKKGESRKISMAASDAGRENLAAFRALKKEAVQLGVYTRKMKKDELLPIVEKAREEAAAAKAKAEASTKQDTVQLT